MVVYVLIGVDGDGVGEVEGERCYYHSRQSYVSQSEQQGVGCYHFLSCLNQYLHLLARLIQF